MSFGRHAYRHAIQPSSTCLIDHVWISEDLLASTFRRFANGQRRYESRVPGPLEARRRLAKRRNTALAGIAGSGPLDDFACLFGRNGREHMKWMDGKGERRKVHPEIKGSDFHPLSSTDSPLPFYSESIDSTQFNTLSGWPRGLGSADRASRNQYLEEFLRTHYTVESIKDVIRQLNIDLQREPAYSRLIFKHLLSHSVYDKSASQELVVFLDDPYLNIRGAGNYLTAVKNFVPHETNPAKRHAPLDAVVRALELGLIPPDELCNIIKAVPQLMVGKRDIAKQNKNFSISFYCDMWDAIGRCDVYQHKDLDSDTVDTWLGVLSERSTFEDMDLAKDIILATQGPNSAGGSWVPMFIVRWLDVSTELQLETSGDYACQLLDHFEPEVASKHIICVTESLVSSRKHHLFEKWQGCLSKLQDISTLVSSKVWINVQPQSLDTILEMSSKSSKLSTEHQIVLRLWVLRTLSKNLSEGPLWRQDLRATDLPILNLFNLYRSIMERITDKGFLTSLREAIHDLNIPSNGLLLVALDLKCKKSMTRATRHTSERLESSNVPFTDIFARLDAYNATSPHFFSAFEKMVREVDITDSSFVEHAIHLARTGDSKTAWTLIRLLRSHTPLKIALSKSWQPIPDPSEKALVRYYPEARTSECPDPHAALELIHLLAISFSCSSNLTPRRAYNLIHWLYVFLVKHSAPVKPSLVRAMYHAGVVRFRREGLRITPTQYIYIFDRVKEIEGPEVVQALMDPPRVGRTSDQDSLDYLD